MARVAVVTGGARGIGSAIVRRLHADGLAVAIMDLGEDSCRALADELNGARPSSAVGIGVDVTNEVMVSDAIEKARAALGPVGVLVNNAGILRDNLLFKMTLEDWEQVMAVHLRGAFLMSRAVQSDMVANSWGRIISLSSISALGNRGQANYSAAKAGIQGLTKTLAIELGKFGVTANAIAPGFIATEMTRITAERMGMTLEQLMEEIAKDIPVGRAGTPEDVAGVASFLAGDDSSYVSGQVLYVAGGPRI